MSVYWSNTVGRPTVRSASSWTELYRYASPQCIGCQFWQLNRVRHVRVYSYHVDSDVIWSEITLTYQCSLRGCPLNHKWYTDGQLMENNYPLTMNPKEGKYLGSFYGLSNFDSWKNRLGLMGFFASIKGITLDLRQWRGVGGQAGQLPPIIFFTVTCPPKWKI